MLSNFGKTVGETAVPGVINGSRHFGKMWRKHTTPGGRCALEVVTGPLGWLLKVPDVLGARDGKDVVKTFVPFSACFDVFPYQHGLWHRLFGS
jgi:hypothetical protein